MVVFLFSRLRFHKLAEWFSTGAIRFHVHIQQGIYGRIWTSGTERKVLVLDSNYVVHKDVKIDPYNCHHPRIFSLCNT